MWSVFYHVAAYTCILVKHKKATALYPDVYVLLYFALGQADFKSRIQG